MMPPPRHWGYENYITAYYIVLYYTIKMLHSQLIKL